MIAKNETLRPSIKPRTFHEERGSGLEACQAVLEATARR